MTRRHAHGERAPKLFLTWAAALTGMIGLVQAAGGVWAGSVALLSDAGHAMMDFVALLFSLLALRLSERPASDRRTFGWHRLEVLAALLNGALVAGVALWIAVEAMRRLRAPTEIKTGPMLAFALAGLAVNAGVAWGLRDRAKRDMNLRGAFLHVASDALASLGVAVAAVLVRVTGMRVFDPAAGLAVASVIAVHAFRLMRDSTHILLEGVPSGLELSEVVRAMSAVPGVVRVEDAHVWGLCSHITSLSAHVTAAPERMRDQQALLAEVNALLRDRFGILHTTLEVHGTDWTRDPAA